MPKIDSKHAPELIDHEWSEIKKLSGLSDAARSKIEEVIAFLNARPESRKPWAREFQEARDANAKARVALSQAAIPALERLLRSELLHLMDKPEPQGDAGLRPISVARPIIMTAIAVLGEVLDRLPPNEAIPHAQGGRPRAPLGVALDQLDLVLARYTGRGLTQSRKSVAFAKAVCRKSMPAVTEDAIIKQIKRIKKARRTSASE
jgi:hypothetical protein